MTRLICGFSNSDGEELNVAESCEEVKDSRHEDYKWAWCKYLFRLATFRCYFRFCLIEKKDKDMHKKSCKIEKNGKWYSKKNLFFSFCIFGLEERKTHFFHVFEQCILIKFPMGSQISFLKFYVLFVFVLFRFKPKWAKPFDEIKVLHSITFLRLLTSTSKMGPSGVSGMIQLLYKLSLWRHLRKKKFV